MAGLTIDEMRLSPNAKKAAQLVLKAHPDARFTSGRRDVMDQARVMAQNVVRYGPTWLKDTYKDQRMVALLMTYTEENREKASSAKLLATGFYETLQEHFAGQLTKFPHVRGDAFDIAWPMLANGLIDRLNGDAICKTIEMLPVELGLQLILRREGRLDVIHAQFNHHAQSVEV
jgi:hypothetical protein